MNPGCPSCGSQDFFGTEVALGADPRDGETEFAELGRCRRCGKTGDMGDFVGIPLSRAQDEPGRAGGAREGESLGIRQRQQLPPPRLEWDPDDAYERSLEEGANEMKWQPIKSAPRGLDILLCEYRNGNYSHIDVGSYGYIENNEWDGRPVYGWLSNNGMIDEPTHWMPLPEPPK